VAQSLAKILVHVVFSTKDRRPFLQDELFRHEVHCYLGGILNHLACQSIIVGGVPDHVHLLASLARTCEPAQMVKELKRASTLWIKEQDKKLWDFSWQSGYGIFSIGFSQIDRVKSYIAQQPQHHQNHSYQEELRRLLRHYQIAYEERYVWD
jgi:putative transposase